MQRNILEDADSIDTAMAKIGTGELLGIDLSPVQLGTHARINGAMRKRQKHGSSDHAPSGMIESFESKMMPSTLLHPLSDSSFAITLKDGATMSDGIFTTNGGTAEIAENASLDFGTGDFTISASVQFQRNGEIEMIAFKNAREPRSKGFGLWRTDNGTINAMLNDGNGNYLTLNSLGKIGDTTGFHDISMVRKNDVLGLWIDGVEQQTRVLEGAQGHYDVTNPAPLIVGKTDNGYYQLQAKIKDLMLTKGAFTPTEIAELQKVQNSPSVSQETVEQIVKTQTETYVERSMLSFADLPNGTYGKGWNYFSLKDGTKIRVFNDEASIVVDNGTIRTQKPNGESSWIWIGFEDGVARKVSSLTMQYDPNSGGSAQPRISFGSNDANHKIVPLTATGMFPINQLMTRAVIETFEHRGTAIVGIEVEVEKTREVPIISQKPAETVESLSAETLTKIAEVVASQEAESVTGPAAPETVDEHAPLLRVVSVQGSNITLAVSSPMTGGNSVRFLNLQDDGLFTNSVIKGVTDGSVTPVSLGMNAANGTGNYRIALVGGPNASTLASVEVHWDRDSKKLSLGGDEKIWECSEARGKAMNEQMQGVLALVNNPTIGSGVLQAMQQESLIDGVRALPSSGISIPEFESSFWNSHPEWKDDAIHETAIRESKTSKYSATQVFNRIVTQRNDTMGILRGAYSKFYSHLGELLQEGLRVLSQIRNAGHEPDLRRNFAILVDQISTNLTMYQLSSIGIRIPDAGTLLEAVKEVWTVRCGELIRISSETTRLQVAEAYQAKLVAKGFIELQDGQKVAADDPRASTKLVFFLDEMNRPTLRPQVEVAEQRGVTYGLDSLTGTNLVASTNNEIISSIYESHELKLTNGEFDGTQDLRIYPTKFGDITFTITQDSMVNLWTGGNALKNLSLTLKGGSLPEDGYNTFTKTGISGDSISLRLTPGNYTMRIQDQTQYNNTNFPVTYSGNSAFVASAGVEIKKYNSAAIHGKMTIEGNPDVMPVSMSVAEFDNAGQRKTNYKETGENAISALDKNKPIWVVVHGMDSHEDKGSIESVARELSAYGSQAGQVVTINWADAADAISITGNDAPWTKSVGEWTASQLIGLGFDASKINIVGHSHGTYVAFAAANKVIELTKGSQINSIVALDPAGNVPALSGFAVGDMNFSNVSRNSLAIEGSWISGNNRLAGTADITFQIDSPGTQTPFSEHSLPITTFASILHGERLHPGQFPNALTLSSIMTPLEQQSATLPRNLYREFYEGIITIDTKTGKDIYGEYLIGIPRSVESGLECVQIPQQ